MRRHLLRTVLTAAAAAVGLGVLAAPASAAQDAPPGTSFLSAGPLKTGEPATWSASAGEYLYWSFPASAGKDVTAKVDIDLPAAATRSGPVTYRVEVYDGLRRRQPCIEGRQVATAAKTDAKVALDCTPRTVRDWAEPWSTDPLPGTYYVRVAAMDVPELDAGLPVKVTVRVDTEDGDEQVPTSDRTLEAPLVPVTQAGKVLQPGQTSDTRSVAWEEPDESWYEWDWMSSPNARWFWTALAGIVTVLTGLLGYHLTRRPRNWFG